MKMVTYKCDDTLNVIVFESNCKNKILYPYFQNLLDLNIFENALLKIMKYDKKRIKRYVKKFGNFEIVEKNSEFIWIVFDCE